MALSAAQMTKPLSFGHQISKKYRLLLDTQHSSLLSNQSVSDSTFPVDKIDVSKFGKIMYASKLFSYQLQCGNWVMTAKVVILLLGVQMVFWEFSPEIIKEELHKLNYKHLTSKFYNRLLKNQEWVKKTSKSFHWPAT